MTKASWRVKLMILLSIVFAILFLFLFFYIYPHLRNQQIKMIRRMQEEVVFSIGRHLEMDLGRVRDNLMKIVEFPEFSNMDIPGQQRIIADHIGFLQPVSSMHVMDAEGWFVSSSDDLSIHTGESYADWPFFAIPFEQGEIYFSPPIFFRTGGFLGTSVNVLIQSDTGKRVGVLTSGMRLTELAAYLTEYPLPEGTVAFLIDQEGTVVAHSGIDLFALEEGPLSLNFSEQALVQATMEGKATESREYDKEGIRYLGSYVTLESSGWGVVAEIPMHLVLAQSNVFAWQLTLVTVIVFAGAFFVLLFFTRQITEEQKQKEEIIREYAEELRTRNEQLKIETKRAKESDRLKSEFLANMSHEIRTPLTAISGAAYLLNESSLSSEQRKLCRMITQSEKHLLQLINDILDLARIEAGEVSLEEIEFSLKESLERIISTFKLEAKEKGLKLDLVYPDSLPARIVSDERKITQIVSNFLSNAVKFTEEGRIEVMVDEEADSKMQVLVRDSGVGIPKDKLAHIFDKFYQVDGTIRRRYSGTGLGLTIVKELAHILGGKIEVKSELKKGSTFSFSFSYRPVEEIVPDEVQDKALAKMEQKARGDISILIAEDDDFNYYIIDRFLKDYTTTRAKDGKDVLEKIEKKRFDLVLMDIQMPEMDGLAATRKIREKNRDLPIIALTAKAMQGDEERCLAAGCTDYISKPITPDELIARIEQYTAKRLVRGEESSPVKVLDIEILLKNSGKDKSLARETLHMFVEYLPQQLSRIRKAITDDNSQNLERLSHSLKGAAKSVGAPRIARLASNLEKTATNSTIGQSESTFSRLEKEKKRFQQSAEKMPIS